MSAWATPKSLILENRLLARKPLIPEDIEIRTPRMLLRVLREEDRAEFIRTQELSAELYRPWLPARASDDTLNAFFDRELTKAVHGAERGVHLRMVGIAATGRMAGFFNLSEIVRGVFQNTYASWSVSAALAG